MKRKVFLPIAACICHHDWCVVLLLPFIRFMRILLGIQCFCFVDKKVREGEGEKESEREQRQERKREERKRK